MRAISMRPALLRRNSTSLTARSKCAAGSYAGMAAAWATVGRKRAAGNPNAPAAANRFRTGRRPIVFLFTGVLPQNDLLARRIADLCEARSSFDRGIHWG